jgi:para-nitrobenzyl esterase
MRFAEPPISTLRWAPTVPLPNSKLWEGVKDATDFGPPCVQPTFDLFKIPIESTDEDCLFANVYSPSNASALPVMVFIHGGAFWGGAGSQYDGSLFASQGVVVVTIDYRLGVLGFLGDSDFKRLYNTTGNFGFLDQVQALKWVQQNIAAFGGNPKRVTIFGESAGGQSVLMHMVSPQSDGNLFQNAIVQSGTIYPELTFTETEANVIAKSFRARVGCLTLDCMKNMDAKELVLAARSSTLPSFLMYPVIDHFVLTGVIADSPTKNKPIVIGTNADEFALFLCRSLDDTTFNDVELYAALVSLFGVEHTLKLYMLYDRYMYASPLRMLVAITSDMIFHCPAKRQASKMDGSYLYSFDAHYSFTNKCWQSSHITELMFQFPSLMKAFAPPGYQPTQQEQVLSAAMIKYWTNFAKTNSPNGDQLPHWPSYDARNYINLSWNISQQSYATDPICEYWNAQPQWFTIQAILAWWGLL